MRNQSWMSRTPVAKLKGWMQQLRQASVKLKTYNMYIDDLYALNAAMGARRGTRRALGPVWDSHNTTWCAALLRNIAFSLVPSALAIYILKFGLKRRKKRKNLICLRCAKKVDFCMCGWFLPLWILCCGRPCTWLNLHEKENYAYVRCIVQLHHRGHSFSLHATKGETGFKLFAYTNALLPWWRHNILKSGNLYVRTKCMIP